MNKKQRQRQRQLKPAAVTGSFYPLGDILNEDIDDGGPITPRLIAKAEKAGDQMRERLLEFSELLTKLRKLGWDGLGTLDFFSIWKEGITKEKAIEELSGLHIDPRSITLQVVGIGDDGLAPDGWVDIGKEFTLPEQTVKELAAIPVEDLNRMRAQLGTMEQALRKERDRRRVDRKRMKSAEAKAEKTNRKNDILTRAVGITSTFVDELLTQRYIKLAKGDE